MRRYSSVAAPTPSYDSPSAPSTYGRCDGPMPSVKPGLPMAYGTETARPACRTGWQG